MGRGFWAGLAILFSAAAVRGDDKANPSSDPSAEGIAFFEKRIRPLFVQRCYECHSSRREEGSRRTEARFAGRVAQGRGHRSGHRSRPSREELAHPRGEAHRRQPQDARKETGGCRDRRPRRLGEDGRARSPHERGQVEPPRYRTRQGVLVVPRFSVQPFRRYEIRRTKSEMKSTRSSWPG